MTTPVPSPKPRAKPKPVVKTAKQKEAAAKAAITAAEIAEAEAAQTAAQAAAARTAQIANLVIAGYSFEAIGAQIGMSGGEVERMVSTDAARYVRSQPSLRVWVRNWISSKYATMIEADWNQASDPDHREKLEHQDRVMRMLDRMARLHGADAPTQTEVKVEAAPEAVEKLVQVLAARQGTGYDADIFDVPDEDITETVHQAPADALAALERSADRVAEPDETDTDWEGGRG